MNLQLVEIDASKKARVQEGTTGMLAAIRGLEVVDVASMENLAIMVGVLKDKKAEIVAFYKPYLEQAQEVKRSAEKNRKMVDTDQAVAIAPYDECIALANRMTQTFRAREQERRDREARAEQERLRKIEEEKRLAEAQKIEEEAAALRAVKPEQIPFGTAVVYRFGSSVVTAKVIGPIWHDNGRDFVELEGIKGGVPLTEISLPEADKVAQEILEVATRVLDEPIITPVVQVEQVSKPLGYKEVTRWKAEVVDFSKVPDEYKLADTVKLNQKATNDKERAIVPGVRFYADTKSY